MKENSGDTQDGEKPLVLDFTDYKLGKAFDDMVNTWRRQIAQTPLPELKERLTAEDFIPSEKDSDKIVQFSELKRKSKKLPPQE